MVIEMEIGKWEMVVKTGYKINGPNHPHISKPPHQDTDPKQAWWLYSC